jgi:hypothetical protein
MSPQQCILSLSLTTIIAQFNGQLTAIAREFNFPSTSGICIYLQLTEGDTTLTPRVSDESWSVLWGGILDDRQQNGLPIAGRIEFDVDLRKARWFDAWVTACRREYDMGVSAPPSAYGLSHRREDSRTTYVQDQQEDVQDESSVFAVPRPSVVPSRHMPRRLSLLERADSMSLRGSVRGGLQPVTPARDDATPVATARVLSPVVQEEEPRTATRDNEIEKKVQSWRAVTNPSLPAVSATGQTALDPVNIPNTVPLPDLDDAGNESELNLDDFTWSISSLGPPSPPAESISSWGRVESVHIDRRGEGSVTLTPSTCTSFGPPDYNPLSPVSTILRLPSPDLGAREIDDAPMTPMTATSWGAPLEFPPSPSMYEYAPSVDVGARHMHSRPVTPATATSWGAPVEFPPSPTQHSRIYTPGLGLSFVDDSEPVIRAAYNVDQWRSNVHDATWKYVWPYHNGPSTSQAPQRSPRTRAFSVVEGKPWRYVWPYQSSNADDSEPWRYVWPYRNGAQAANADDSTVDAPLGAPWTHVWPYQQTTRLSVEQSSIPVSAPATRQHVWSQQQPQQADSRVELTITLPQKSAREHDWPYQQTSPQEAEPAWKYVWPYVNGLSTPMAQATSPSPRRRAFTETHVSMHVRSYAQKYQDTAVKPVTIAVANKSERRGYPYIELCTPINQREIVTSNAVFFRSTRVPSL